MDTINKAVRFLLTATLVTVVLSNNPGIAADVKVSGLIYGQYANFLSENNSTGTKSKGRGDFSITRTYLIGEGKFNDKLKGKIVLESNTTQTADVGHGSNSVFLKYAFLDHSLCPNANVVFGLIGTPWISYEEGIWGRRFVQQVQVNQEGVLSPADKGVGIYGKLPADYGDFNATYVNGEGTTTTEKAGIDGRRKDAMARVSVTPIPENDVLKNFKIHGYLQEGQIKIGTDQRRNRQIGALSYQTDKFHVMGSYVWGQTGNDVSNVQSRGYSVHGSVKSPWNFNLFARYDWYDPSKSTSGDSFHRSIFGLDSKLTDGVRLSLNDQIIRQQTVFKQNENQVLLQAEVKF